MNNNNQINQPLSDDEELIIINSEGAASILITFVSFADTDPKKYCTYDTFHSWLRIF